VLEGGRASSRIRQRALYRRRRVVAVLLALVLVTGVTLLAVATLARLAGDTPSPVAGGSSSFINPPASADASGAVEAAARSVVVQPGDTLWTIASRIAPDTDVRVTVDRLQALNGHDPIVPGEALELPR
jgi:Tfp pilus assembly protein FimV